MTEAVKKIFETEQLRLNESMVFPEAGDYWQSTVLERDGFPVAGGFDRDRSRARKVAISELLERRTFSALRSSNVEVRRAWGLDTHPTACGFAGGFELEGALQRSMREAVERWVMSLWIDDHFKIAELTRYDVIDQLDPASRFFLDQFDDVRFFLKLVDVEYEGRDYRVKVAQTIALKDGGVFPGSSAQAVDGNLWQHALLESYRHLLGHKFNPKRDAFPDRKVHYFAQNADAALGQIALADRVAWPKPIVKLRMITPMFEGKFFVVRTLLDGWKSWHEGSLERFLY